MVRFISSSANQTKKIGRQIGRLLQAGDVAALIGDLGAGKTTLVKGIAKGLQVKCPEDQILSPSFVLIHEYQGREKIYHVDWYRLESVEGADELLAEECFGDKAVTLVEWADRAEALLPKSHLRIHLKHKGENQRIIDFSGKGKRAQEVLCSLKK